MFAARGEAGGGRLVARLGTGSALRRTAAGYEQMCMVEFLFLLLGFGSKMLGNGT